MALSIIPKENKRCKELLAVTLAANIVYPHHDDENKYNETLYLEAIPKYKEYGFSHIEFSCIHKLDETVAARIREFCQKTGIIPWSIHSENLNADGAQALEEYLLTQRRCCKIAKALGTKVVVCHIPNVFPRAKAFERDLDILTQVADISREYGLKLALETPPYDYMIKLVDAIGRDDVGINLDAGHSFLEGNDPAFVVREIGKRLFTTHLQDNFGVNDDHQPPGLGKINWEALLSALKEIGYNGPLMMEMHGSGVKKTSFSERIKRF